MLWAWGLITAIAVGLPVAAWWLSRNLKPRGPPFGSRPRRFDRVGRWLFDHYHLGVLDRQKVAQAVFVTPTALSDPTLRNAAHELAAEVLSGKLKPYAPQQAWAGTMFGLGLAYTTLAMVEPFVTRAAGGLPFWCLMAYGLLFVVGGPVLAVWAPRRALRRVKRALRLNEDAAHRT